MIVRNFSENDIQEASQISHLVWGDLYTKESDKLQKLIYDFMVKYYVLNRKYSFSMEDDGFKGFILANTKYDKNESINYFKEAAKELDENEAKTAII